MTDRDSLEKLFKVDSYLDREVQPSEVEEEPALFPVYVLEKRIPKRYLSLFTVKAW